MGKKTEDSPEMTARKIKRQAEELIQKNNVEGLRDLFASTFGRDAPKSDKRQLAVVLAQYLVTGIKPTFEAGELPPEREAAMIRGILDRVRSAWDEVERLGEEKRAILGDFRTAIDEARAKIADVLSPSADERPAVERLGQVEDLWRAMAELERQRSEAASDYRQRIKSASLTIKGEIENARQLPLFEGAS